MKAVIRKGTNLYKQQCAYCGCVFTYNGEDIKEGYVNCPLCPALMKHYVEFEVPPEKVRNQDEELNNGSLQ